MCAHSSIKQTLSGSIKSWGNGSASLGWRCQRTRRGLSRSSQYHAPGKTSFDFLGFEFRWGKDRAGKPRVQRRTSRKKLRNSLKQFTVWCQEKCRHGLKDLFRELNAKLRGYYNYYGVNGNYASLNQFFKSALRILFKWLNRRSQRRSYNWTGFRELLRFFQIEQPYIVGRPKPRRIALGT